MKSKFVKNQLFSVNLIHIAKRYLYIVFVMILYIKQGFMVWNFPLMTFCQHYNVRKC